MQTQLCSNVECSNPANPRSTKGYCTGHMQAARAAWKAMIAEKQAGKPSKADREAAHANLLRDAHEAGMRAGEAANPTPMLVGTPRNLLGSLMGGDDGGFDPAQPVYRIDDGVCGFAWVNLPGTSSFAKWLKATGQARVDSYYGGVTVSVHQFNQSLTRKEAYANAFAQVLRDAGIQRVNVGSRMD